ncbi:MAG: membrane dipeptidase, partial [Oscillospiraceae bacterium]
SHLNDVGFYDVLRVAKKPIIATHSNSRKISPHLRNLTDEEIKEIISMGGLIGLNFYIEFLNADKEKANLMDLFHHAEHILELGGENVLAMGSDFDGCQVFEDLNSMEKAVNLGDFFVSQGIPKEIANKILFDNAFNFFKENVK